MIVKSSFYCTLQSQLFPCYFTIYSTDTTLWHCIHVASSIHCHCRWGRREQGESILNSNITSMHTGLTNPLMLFMDREDLQSSCSIKLPPTIRRLNSTMFITTAGSTLENQNSLRYAMDTRGTTEHNAYDNQMISRSLFLLLQYSSCSEQGEQPCDTLWPKHTMTM